MFLLFIFILLFSSNIGASANQTSNNKGTTNVETQGQIPPNMQINNTQQPGQQQPPLPQQPYFVINLSQTNSNNNDQANSQTSTNNNVHTNQTSFVNQIKQSILKFLSFAKKEAPKQQEIALSFFQQHRTMVLLGVLACSYGLLFAYINTLSNFLADKEGWHNWKREMSIEEIVMHNQTDLAQTLCVTIQQKYFNPQKPGNSMKAFTRFYKDIEKEMQKIDRYIQVGKFINTCQLSYFFQINKKRIKRAVEKKKRLEIMQKILITYMSTQNTMPAMGMVRSHKFEQVMKIVKNTLFEFEKKEFTEQQS